MRNSTKRNHDSDNARLKAQRHVRQLGTFYRSLTAYIAVNILLLLVHLFVSRIPWAPWVTFGWGLGLVFQASAIFGLSKGLVFGEAWQDKKVDAILARENLKTVSSEKRLVQAQLQLLQAQIEPHFLFNTLANVQSLIGKSPDKATLMLENLIAYLRTSLSASRNINGTLGQEIELVKNYLDLIKIRMGERLQYAINIDANLTNQALAPMLLQPIVENAIKHGLEPKVEGGDLSISAKSVGQTMQIIIIDNGLGFSAQPGSGVGLSNLRQRLDVMYDGQASMQIIAADIGTRVELSIPLQTQINRSAHQ